MRKLLFALALVMLFGISYADAALPPMRFHVMYNGSNVNDEVVYAAVLDCYTRDALSTLTNYTGIQHPSLLVGEYDASRNCTWYPERGATEIDCSNGVCEFYSYTNPFRFAVYIPSVNKTFVSGSEENTFGDFLFNISASGEVGISKMTPRPSIMPLFPMDEFTLVGYSLALTVAVELVTSFIYLHLRKLEKGIMWSVILANIISVPLLWIFLWMVSFDALLMCLSLLSRGVCSRYIRGCCDIPCQQKKNEVSRCIRNELNKQYCKFPCGTDACPDC